MVELICEIGVNHNGDMEQAHALIDMIADAGAKIAKFQAISKETTFNYANMSGPIFEAIQKAYLNKQQFKELKQHCDSRNIEFMCSAADIPALEMLAEI